VLINANDANNPDLLQQRGQEQSKGVDIDINGRILNNLSVSANYAYTQSTITQSASPALVGTGKEFTPDHMGAVWLRYNIIRGGLKGLGLSFGGNFVSSQNTTQYAQITLPTYTVFNAALFYQIQRVQLSVNVNNLTDKTYWLGRGRSTVTVNPGAPRNALFSIGYRF
jgi:iron complex outermembrane receptor protein